MKRRSLIKKLLILGIILLLYLLLRWAGKINRILLVDRGTTEPAMIQVAQHCLDNFVGRSLWSLADEEVQKVVTQCDATFGKVTIRHLFPSRLEVGIQMFQPVVKIELKESNCLLLESSSKSITLPVERCIMYKLPLLKGTGVEDNVFVHEYIAELARALSDAKIRAKNIEYRGDTIAPWYVIELEAGGKVYFPSSAAVSDKVLVLSAALKGLNAAKERYSVVDVRFDRVVYK